MHSKYKFLRQLQDNAFKFYKVIIELKLQKHITEHFSLLLQSTLEWLVQSVSGYHKSTVVLWCYRLLCRSIFFILRWRHM